MTPNAVPVSGQKGDNNLTFDDEGIVIVRHKVQSLISCILQPVNTIAVQTHTSQKACTPTLLVRLFIVPNTNCNCIRLADKEIKMLIPLGVNCTLGRLGGVRLA